MVLRSDFLERKVSFFLTFESNGLLDFVVHGAAASFGEIIACLVRVPTELVKQRSQVMFSYYFLEIFILGCQ